VPARSPKSLADAILNFLDEPATWRRWALQGRQRVEAQFDFKARTRKLEAIYVEMIERESARTGKLEHSTAGLR
jgi:glycosyltransferase involved in cell wall biosynthesis